MNWTETDRQELSRKVAEKYSVAGYVGQYLHTSWEAIMELSVKHGVSVIHSESRRCVHSAIGTAITVNYEDHNNDPSLAERIARMMALMEI